MSFSKINWKDNSTTLLDSMYVLRLNHRIFILFIACSCKEGRVFDHKLSNDNKKNKNMRF